MTQQCQFVIHFAPSVPKDIFNLELHRSVPEVYFYPLRPKVVFFISTPLSRELPRGRTQDISHSETPPPLVGHGRLPVLGHRGQVQFLKCMPPLQKHLGMVCVYFSQIHQSPKVALPDFAKHNVLNGKADRKQPLEINFSPKGHRVP